MNDREVIEKQQKKLDSLFKFIFVLIVVSFVVIGSVCFGIALNKNDNNNNNGCVNAYTTLNGYTPTWSYYRWLGYNIAYGFYVYDIDGTDYYSFNTTHYVYDASSHTWSYMTWNGLSSFNGNCVWTDGVDYYYSSGSNQYVLDVSTSTWSSKTWNGLTNFVGNYVWTDGVDYYYSNQYVLNISTSTWSAMTWNGLSNFSTEDIWTDGVDYYYSSGYTQYLLDVSTSTWSTKTWVGLSSFYGRYHWYVNFNNVRYNFLSTGYNNYLIDISNYSISQFDFAFESGYTGSGFDGSYVYYLDGDAYYYSGSLDGYGNTTMRLSMVNLGSGSNNNTPLYTFNGSNILLPFSTYLVNGQNYSYDDSIYYADFSLYFDTTDNTNTTFRVNFSPVRFYLNDNNSFGLPTGTYSTGTLGTDFDNFLTDNKSFTFDSTDFGSTIYFYAYNGTNLGNIRLIKFSVDISQNFTSFNFIGCREYSSYNGSVYQNHIRYFDSDLNYIDVSCYYYFTGQYQLYALQDRTYYFSNAISGGYSEDALQNAYNEGVQDGEVLGYDTAYNDGYSAGELDTSNYYNNNVLPNQYNTGYNAGYSAGVNDSNNYTFGSLIGAVIDVPVNTFTSLFNIELLGVNILSFLTGLLTLALVLAILRLFI